MQLYKGTLTFKEKAMWDAKCCPRVFPRAQKVTVLNRNTIIMCGICIALAVLWSSLDMNFVFGLR